MLPWMQKEPAGQAIPGSPGAAQYPGSEMQSEEESSPGGARAGRRGSVVGGEKVRVIISVRVGVGGAVVAGGSAISCKKPAARKKIVPRGHDGAVREVQRALEHAGEVVRRVGRLGEQGAQCRPCPTGKW